MEQSIDAAQIDKGAVVGDVFHQPFDDRAFCELFHQLRAFLTLRQLNDSATGQDHVIALAIELDDLKFHGLALKGRGVLDRSGVDERTGKEGTDAVSHDGQSALDLACDGACD